MVGSLKERTLAMQSALRHRGNVLNAAESALEKSAAGTVAAAAQAGKQVRSAAVTSYGSGFLLYPFRLYVLVS